MPLTPELKERIVMALVAAEGRVEQCRMLYVAPGGRACALGVIGLEVFGMKPEAERKLGWANVSKIQTTLGELANLIMFANDSGSSFDEIARMVKEWPCEGEEGE